MTERFNEGGFVLCEGRRYGTGMGSHSICTWCWSGILYDVTTLFALEGVAFKYFQGR